MKVVVLESVQIDGLINRSVPIGVFKGSNSSLNSKYLQGKVFLTSGISPDLDNHSGKCSAHVFQNFKICLMPREPNYHNRYLQFISQNYSSSKTS